MNEDHSRCLRTRLWTGASFAVVLLYVDAWHRLLRNKAAVHRPGLLLVASMILMVGL